MEKMNEIKRSELWYKIHSIVSQIPKREVDGDCMDYPSASTQIEKLLATEDKKAPVDEDVNKILSKHIKYFDSWPHLHSLCKSDVLNAYNAIPKAMQEYASQERNRAIQQAIEIINEKLPFEFKTRFSPDYHEINIALEKLKKDS